MMFNVKMSSFANNKHLDLQLQRVHLCVSLVQSMDLDLRVHAMQIVYAKFT